RSRLEARPMSVFLGRDLNVYLFSFSFWFVCFLFDFGLLLRLTAARRGKIIWRALVNCNQCKYRFVIMLTARFSGRDNISFCSSTPPDQELAPRRRCSSQ